MGEAMSGESGEALISQQRREDARQEVLDYIYSRAGRATAVRGQRHLREFSEDAQ
jgi:hypothetical protein